MTQNEHLLTILAEECIEVAHRITKALRFGLHEVEPGQPLNNGQRIHQEFQDVLAMAEMLNPVMREFYMPDGVDAKKAKVRKFLEYSRQCGTLTDEPPTTRSTPL